MARPLSLTPEVAEKLIAARADGKDNAAAAKAAGISEPTLYRHLARGEAHLIAVGAGKADLDGPDALFGRLAVAYRDAEKYARNAKRAAILARFRPLTAAFASC